MLEKDRIILKEDIIKEVVDETGKSEKLIKDMVEHSLKYIKHLIDTEPEIVTISLPNLSKLKANYSMVIARANNSEVFEKRREFMQKNLHKTKHYDVPLVELISSKERGVDKRNFYKKYYERLKFLEYENNKSVEKYFS